MLDQDFGKSFDLKPEAICPSHRGAPDTTGTKVPKRQIDFVYAIKKRAPSAQRTGAIAVAIVHPRPPIRQVRTGLQTRGKDISGRAVFDQALDQNRAGMKAHVTTHHSDQPATLDG